MGIMNEPLSRSSDYADIRTAAEHTGILVASVLMMVIGWGGLYLLITTTRPHVGQRWLFFVLLHIAVTGIMIPFVRYLNLRFTSVHRALPSGGVIIRQAVWIGLFAVTCAWLQLPRVLSVPIAFFVALAFIVIEIFLRSRELAHERSQ